MQGSTEVKLLRNALWPPNLEIEHLTEVWCIDGSKVMQGSTRVSQGSNCSGMPYNHQIWWEKPLTKVECKVGSKVKQGSTGVNQGLNFSGMTYGHQIVKKEPLTEVQCIDGIKGQPGSTWVKLLRNAIRAPNLIERTIDQSVINWWGQMSCSGQLGSTTDQMSQECSMVTKFCINNP